MDDEDEDRRRKSDEFNKLVDQMALIVLFIGICLLMLAIFWE